MTYSLNCIVFFIIVLTSYNAMANCPQSVQTQGAVAGDSQDDSEAFNSSIISAASNGCGIVYVPGGIYHLTTPVVLLSGVELRGDGMVSQLVKIANVAGGVIEAQRDQENISVRNLSIEGGPSHITKSYGILLDGCNNCEIDSVEIKDIAGGIALVNTTDLESNLSVPKYSRNIRNVVRKCRVKNILGYGIQLRRAYGALITENFVTGSKKYDGFKVQDYSMRLRIHANYSSSNNRDGFDFFDGLIESVVSGNISEANKDYGFDIKGRHARDNEYYAKTSGKNYYSLREVVFSSNVATSNGNAGFALNSAMSITLTDNLAVENASAVNGSGGFVLVKSHYGVVQGNISKRNFGHGFVLDGARHNSVSGNVAVDNGFAGRVGQVGFLLKSDARYNLLSGNQSLNGKWASGNCPSGETVCSGKSDIGTQVDGFKVEPEHTAGNILLGNFSMDNGKD